MAGQLIQVATETVTSAVASVTLTGIDSDDVYMFTISGAKCSENDRYGYLRVTEGGTENSSANYDKANKTLYSATTFSNDSGTNATFWDRISSLEGEFLTSGVTSNAIMYLYNMNSTTEYAFMTHEGVTYDTTLGVIGAQGGGVFTSSGTARDGVKFFWNSGNVTAGTFTLYKVV